ncbi:M23 family metallopeptidase [Myxococcus landrumensis]|uniref:M23 family metallopeptidase n=1 Tax=Myxococcus landrumensis TaxID=2813577 RepID=A0ABX7NG11_9BACT|nr:M23 family metallopeptidase [Myxococcus landrumus]QSQ17720.1 M23 family metallopeptidase [Myxococcus landrumus]
MGTTITKSQTTTTTRTRDTEAATKPRPKLVLPLDKPLPKKNPSFSQADGKEGMPDGKGGYRHGGLDWFAKPGTKVRAPVDGKVIAVTKSKGSSGQVFGGTVKVQGKDGKVWVFRHVDPSKVKVGQKVAAGDTIAKVADWKGSSGDHVHVEVWKSLKGGYHFNNAIDPVKALKGAARDVDAKAATSASMSSVSGTLSASAQPTPGNAAFAKAYGADMFEPGVVPGNVAVNPQPPSAPSSGSLAPFKWNWSFFAQA